nr:PREDICTED: solute carrier organic anion transporter family member 1C1-like isoform X2 [Latimeria chalumnae]|eukprot:XP_014345633.1 PREDICTED: solute carrier organic anion transporter family member 1C1-like isoform X2 [Latimeria chalumnae]
MYEVQENITMETKTTEIPEPSLKAKQNEEAVEPELKKKKSCCSKLMVFLAALSFAYFAKALSGSYMKSSITQIERRFELPTSVIGLIDGSFEMGNLLVIAIVSHFGAKLHRPRIIGVGCIIMAIGTFITALPHFFMGPYKYETALTTKTNSTENIVPCLPHQSYETLSGSTEKMSKTPDVGCIQEAGSPMWIYVFMGNLLRGLGETPVMPLGVSFIDDFAKEENSAFYIDSLTITPKDSRWVGAWWLGFLIASVVTLIAAIPFWFIPKSLAKQEEGKKETIVSETDKFISKTLKEQNQTLVEPVKISKLAKDFLPSLKNLFSNRIYFLYLCTNIIQFNAFIGMLTYKPKYMEQQYGQSASKANLYIGLTALPAVAIGIFLGGFLMKKFNLSIISAAKLSFGTSFFAYLLSFSFFAMSCSNSEVAGLTVSYEGMKQVSYHDGNLFSQCNSVCKCPVKQWDPVCGYNGMTYVSPCHAGCKHSFGSGINTIFHNCSCIEAYSLHSGNFSAILGQCPKTDVCANMFLYFVAISVISAFFFALGATPGYIVLIRAINPELKSLALGMYILAVRTLAGIPAPIYFGALIDTTCLKWGTKKCGGRGACRLYNTDAYRHIYLGLTSGLRTLAYILGVAVLYLIIKQFKQDNKDATPSGRTDEASAKKEEANSKSNDHLTATKDLQADKETCI